METYLAVDIGTSSIKAVEKDTSGQAIRWGILTRHENPFHSSIQPLDIEDAARGLKALIERMGSTAQVAVASIPAFLALLAVAESENPRFIPAAPGTFTMSAVSMDPVRSGPQSNWVDWSKYLLAAIPNAVAEKYAEIFFKAGLRLEKIALESSALAAQLGNDPSPVLIIDVGERSTTFTVAQEGKVKYIEQTDFALASHAPDVIIKKAEKIAAGFQTKRNVLCGGAALLNLKGFVAPNSILAIPHGLSR